MHEVRLDPDPGIVREGAAISSAVEMQPPRYTIFLECGMSRAGEAPDTATIATESAALEQRLRADITQWVGRMLLLAYQPLGDQQVETLIDFVSTPAAQVLSDCLTRAFDAVFMRLSFEVGMISGAAFGGEEI